MESTLIVGAAPSSVSGPGRPLPSPSNKGCCAILGLSCFQGKEPTVAETDARMPEIDDYEAACLRAAYADLFGQEYHLSQAAPTPVQPAWLIEQ